MTKVHRAFNHATPEKPSKEYWIGTPKKAQRAPADSWWTKPAAQRSHEDFRKAFEAEAPRIIGDPRFGGAKRVHDSGLDSDS